MFVFNCVGTPPKADGSCDLSHIQQVANQIGELISDYTIIVNKSTVPVGTADEVRKIIASAIERRGIQVEFDVVSNPEFLKEGDAVNDFLKPDRVIVGTDNIRTAKLLETLYAPFARSRDKLITMGVHSAEMTKYAANCMLATKISFINEMANICERVGADIKDVRIGIGSDSRIGYSFIYPGVGYGGSCFPKDIKALINTSQSAGYEPELISAVDNVNEKQKRLLSDKILAHFEEKQGGLKNKRLAIWGLTFKSNTNDMRESAAISIIECLTQKGVEVIAFDPKAGPEAEIVFKDNTLVTIASNQYDVLTESDGLAVITDWNQFRNPDFNRIRKMLRAQVIFDGRNLYSESFLISQGFAYIGIGRPLRKVTAQRHD